MIVKIYLNCEPGFIMSKNNLKFLFFAILTLCILRDATPQNPGNDCTQAAREAIAQQNYDLAIEQYDRALRFGFDSSKVHFKKGVAFYQETKYGQAMQELLGVDNNAVEYPRALFHLGLIELDRDSLPAAIDVLDSER